MPANQKSIDKIINELDEWCNEYNVRNDAMYILLRRLSSVSGNKSFTKSVEMLRRTYQQLNWPEEKTK